MTTIENNTVARVHYTGTLPDTGEVFDSSEGREPLTFLVGHKQMIPGFERELMGAKVGDKVEFTLSAEDAYGEHNPDAIQQVTEVGDKEITVDFNHALAGKSLTFNVEVIDVRPAEESEIMHGHAHGPGGVQHEEPSEKQCNDDGCC